MLRKIRNFVIDDNELDAGWQRFLSLVFLTIAGLMSFMAYTHKGMLWDSELQFRPGFPSTIIALVLVAPLYLRNILKWNRSIYTILSFILICLLFSSFVELATGGNQKSSVIYTLLAISVALSWLGIRGVAGISWILVLASAVYAFIVNGLTLEFYGFVYVLSGFLGLLMHTGLDPGTFMQSIKAEYSSATVQATTLIREEIKDTGKSFP